jgi:hypothetical protein
MPVEVTTSGFTNPVLNSRNIDIDMIGIPVSGTEVMYGFVGLMDDGSPRLHSAKFTVTSAFSQDMELVSQNVGAGGDPFPAGIIVALKNPVATSGTLRVEFDETVAVMNGVGLVYTGLNTASDFSPHTGPATNTQSPQFLIQDTLTVPSGHLVLDLCVAASSNHTVHAIPSGLPAKSVAESSISMHKLSIASQVSDGGTVTIAREDAGGPFAGTTLAAVSIETL